MSDQVGVSYDSEMAIDHHNRRVYDCACYEMLMAMLPNPISKHTIVIITQHYYTTHSACPNRGPNAAIQLSLTNVLMYIRT